LNQKNNTLKSPNKQEKLKSWQQQKQNQSPQQSPSHQQSHYYPSSHHHHHYQQNPYRPALIVRNYLPYYSYYYYHYHDFYSYFPEYFHLYHIHQPYFSYGPLIFNSGDMLTLNDGYILNRYAMRLNKCQNGPEFYFKVNTEGKVFRVFLGDLDDLLNIQCLYMMKAVIVVGKIDHAMRLYEILSNPEKVIYRNDRAITLNPLRNNQNMPENPDLRTINHNIKELSFDIGDLNLERKSILFYQTHNINNTDEIFSNLDDYMESSGNVLYVVDKLQNISVRVFHNFLVRYRRFSPYRIRNIRYKRLFLFPRRW